VPPARKEVSPVPYVPPHHHQTREQGEQHAVPDPPRGCQLHSHNLGAAHARATAAAAATNILRPMRPTQFILKFRNPIFERVRVKLATPRKTPGRFSAEVTLLCHEFHIDANTDMWEDAQDALKQGDTRASGRPDDAALQQGGGMDKYEVPYERARNWVSIVIEVKPDPMAIGGKGPTDMKEDEDVLEIPIYVRLEWEAEGQGDVGGSLDKDKEGKETRGLEYWCVLGVGRIVQG
jgi:dynactin-4